MDFKEQIANELAECQMSNTKIKSDINELVKELNASNAYIQQLARYLQAMEKVDNPPQEEA